MKRAKSSPFFTKSAFVKMTSAALLLGASLGGACGEKAAPEAPKTVVTKHGLTGEQAKQVLAKIGDETITLGDFAEQLADKSPYLRARYASPQRRRELLEEIIRFELLAREAARRGLDKDPEVQRARRQVMIQQMMKTEFEDKVKLADISDQEIEAYYKAHPDEFNKPQQVRASQIVLKDEATAKRVLKQLQEKADDNRFFREQAAALSIDTGTSNRGGDLQFFSMPAQRVAGDPDVPDAVAEAAFKIENVGDLFPTPVKSPLGFHIIKLTGKRKELARTLDQARRPIQHRLWRERREAAIDAFVADLRKKGRIEENEGLLAQVVVPAGSATDSAKPQAAGGHAP